MISWVTVETAIVTWARGATGLGQNYVILANQSGPRPDNSFVTILLDGPAPIGRDGITQKYEAGAANGQQIVIKATGPRELVVRVSVFDGDACGDFSSRAMASHMVSTLSLPGVRAALNAAGLGISTVGKVQSVPAVRAAAFEARATFDITMLVFDSAEERTTWIERAQVKVTDAVSGTTLFQKTVP